MNALRGYSQGMSDDERIQKLESALWAIKMQASRRKRASGLKKYLVTDLEIIERAAKRALK